VRLRRPGAPVENDSARYKTPPQQLPRECRAKQNATRFVGRPTGLRRNTLQRIRGEPRISRQGYLRRSGYQSFEKPITLTTPFSEEPLSRSTAFPTVRSRSSRLVGLTPIPPKTAILVSGQRQSASASGPGQDFCIPVTMFVYIRPQGKGTPCTISGGISCHCYPKDSRGNGKPR